MEQRGFIQNMLDVKVLILFVAARAEYPVTMQQLYELCYQDDRLSYFDLSVAVPQMVESGHLEQLPDGSYRITQKGRENERLTFDSIAFSVRERAQQAVERFNRARRRSDFISSELQAREDGTYTVVMKLSDELGSLMRLELGAPNLTQARALGRAYEESADAIFRMVMDKLLG